MPLGIKDAKAYVAVERRGVYPHAVTRTEFVHRGFHAEVILDCGLRRVHFIVMTHYQPTFPDFQASQFQIHQAALVGVVCIYVYRVQASIRKSRQELSACALMNQNTLIAVESCAYEPLEFWPFV